MHNRLSTLKSFSLGLMCAMAVSMSSAANAQVRINGQTLEQIAKASRTPLAVKAIESIPYREELRVIVDMLTQYANKRDPNFKIIGRNPEGLMVTSEWEELRASIIDPDYLNRAIIPDDAPGGPLRRMQQDFDAAALDNQNCPKPPPAKDAPPPTKAELKKIAFDKRLKASIRNAGTTLISLDACGPKHSIFTIARHGRKAKLASIAVIGTPDIPARIPGGRLPYENSDNVTAFKNVKNGLWVRNPRTYASKGDWLVAMSKNNADVMIIDAFYKNDAPITKAEVLKLKYKYMGAKRLLLASVDLGTARDDRFYWKKEWRMGNPAFLRQPSEKTLSGIAVNYWDPEWKAIMGEYFKGIMDLGFDGIMLQGLNAADAPEEEALLE